MRVKQTIDSGTKNLGDFSSFIKNLSKDFPVIYGIISIIFAIVLGIAAAFIRRFFSNLRKKYMQVKINFLFYQLYLENSLRLHLSIIL